MNDTTLQKIHFDRLRAKYKIISSRNFASDSFLYLILRKADLGMEVTDVELQWLADNHFFDCIELISLQQYQAKEEKRLETELMQLRAKYLIPDNIELPIASSIDSVLWKLDNKHKITNLDIKLLNTHNLVETIALIKDIENFSKLKNRFKVTQESNIFPEEPLYIILKKLSVKEELSDSEAEWLLNSGLQEALKTYQQQKNIRKAELEFLELKSKYQVDYYKETVISSKLYSILKKLDSGDTLDHKDAQWLKKKKLNSLIKLDEEQRISRLFIKLKETYHATQNTDTKACDRLFKVLIRMAYCDTGVSKLLRIIQTLPEHFKSELHEKDINWLAEQGLCETAEIARKIHFQSLKSKYRIIGHNLPLDPFYLIMLKLEREERLDPKQVVQLIEEDSLSKGGK
ncbi:hypothetical protein [Mastigocoleus sp. MO_188.B34]|uniref:hypothetical protein n=1 Tax=Mastigocoleus sp. MO_188.B34 TaxID=3036635 RepID=UPI0026146BFC|nr:hypothetical protein [Mastigocoleus sp. MO_188.B34]MDJ0694439.1 hypothetical protein [Mastigocoleus sp. MO_188.B34]